MFKSLRKLVNKFVDANGTNVKKEIKSINARQDFLTVMQQLKSIGDNAVVLPEEYSASKHKSSSRGHDKPIALQIIEKNLSVPMEKLTNEEIDNIAQYFALQGKHDNAVEYWSHSSDRGSITGEYALALCRKEGLGVAKDFEKALATFFKLADEQRHPFSHYTIGKIFKDGKTKDSCAIDANSALSFKYFVSAAKFGIVPAMYNVGNCYAYSDGVEQNDEAAAAYYEAASARGDIYSTFTIATWHYQGRHYCKDTKKSFELYSELAGAHNHNLAQHNLACQYLTGNGTDQNFGLALAWFEKAASQGNCESMVNAAQLYLKQDSPRGERINKALEIMKVGKEKGHRGCIDFSNELTITQNEQH